MSSGDDRPIQHTPLHDLHVERGGKMVPFAGYSMPIQYAAGVLQEHLHTRTKAGLFDVSHMGQIELRPKSAIIEDAKLALERLVPADIASLATGRQRYAVFTDDDGGVLDDLMVANLGDRLYLVVNAACKAADLAHLKKGLSDLCHVSDLYGRGLLALQGPQAESSLERIAPDARGMAFMDIREIDVAGVPCTVSRSGYTGEDGYEIGMECDDTRTVACALLALPDVTLIGLGARDSLRLEAGLCLYGSELSKETSPVEAAIEWSIQKSRRPGGPRAGGYPGATRIEHELTHGAPRRRVGLCPEGRLPVRAGSLVFSSEASAAPVGSVTSGGYAPSAGVPVAMGFVDIHYTRPGTSLFADVRGRRVKLAVVEMPFVQKTYKR